MSLYRDLLKSKVDWPGVGGRPAPVFIDVTDIRGSEGAETAYRSLPPFQDAWIEMRCDSGTVGVRCLAIPGIAGCPMRVALLTHSYVRHLGNVRCIGRTFTPLDDCGDTIFLHTGPGRRVARLMEGAIGYWPYEGSGPPACGPSGAPGDPIVRMVWVPTSATPERDLLLTTANLVLDTYDLLNCRNVAAAPIASPGRHMDKHGKRGITWHRLVIVAPGKRSADSPLVGAGVGQPMTRAHLTRGHFKVFSTDAPLFGKYTGRFWWMPAVRGDKERGVVLKDYELRASHS